MTQAPTLPRPQKSLTLGTEVELFDDSVTEAAKALIYSPRYVSVENKTHADILIVSPKDLGFTERTSLIGMESRLVAHGFGRCLHDVGPTLMTSYPEQEESDAVTIIMDPIIQLTPIKEYWVFQVRTLRGKQILDAVQIPPGPSTFGIGQKLAFQRM